MNITIDDADGSIQYSGKWHTDCPSHLEAVCIDPNKVHNKTVHWNWPSDSDGSHGSITISFSGTAVYVYNVIPAAHALEAAVANIAFTLDGIPVQSYEQPQGSGDPEYLYHQLVYMNDALSNGTHELVIVGGKSLVLFDYIEYTSESSDGFPPAMTPISSPTTTSPPPPLAGPPTMPTSTVMTPQHTTTLVAPPLDTPDTPTPMVTDAPTSTATGGFTSTAIDTTTAMATPSSKGGSNRSAGAIAGGIVGSVLALLLLGVITLFVRRRLSAHRGGKGMGRLLDEGPPPRMDIADHSMSNRGQFLRPTYPALRPSPDVPRSPGYTSSSMPTSPTSYGGEPPSRTYMNDGTVATILEKADRARTEWPSSTGTRAFPAAFGTMERW
ncbi:hypothetical protein GSI_05967 [Ganoderma sinense ZZ0214-1]|uniref:Uncharacterized protein n=1 Tax=Ganoderma sinense ZZ0214-1 TaxID=1077348 RepID=A0A2G8SBY8_9APHY|nr:hypothetical protein GSI_05967 [Ganoderma sinense ZZ0214-1]